MTLKDTVQNAPVERVLILGATSSVAANVARIYASRGAKLFLIGRQPQKLEPLAKELASHVVGTLTYDFLEYAKTPPTIAQAFEMAGGFDLVIIAHGLLGDQPRSEADFDEALLQIGVNYVSVVAQLIAIVKQFEKTKSTAIGTSHRPGSRPQVAVISSVAGDRGRPRNYTYGSAKGALTLYLQGLRSSRYGAIDFTTIKLGPVDTPMTVHHEKNALFSTSPRAASLIVRAIERRKSEVYVPGYFRFVMGVVTRLPEPLFQKLKFLSAR